MASHVQSVLFDRKKWGILDAYVWLKDHGYRKNKLDITDKYLRFRQEIPDYDKYMYRIHRIGKNITLELGFPIR